MPYVTPPKPRYKVDDRGDRLRFIIPNPRFWPSIVVLSVWLGIMGAVLAAVVGQSLSLALAGKFPAALMDWLGLVAGLVLYIAPPLYIVLWQVIGNEQLEFSRDGILVRRKVWGLGGTRRYPVDEVGGLRVLPAVGLWTVRPFFLLLHRPTPAMEFRQHGKRIRVAGFLFEAEVKQIYSLVAARFPGYTAAAPQDTADARFAIDLSPDGLTIRVLPQRRRLRSAYMLFCLGLTGLMAVPVTLLFIPARPADHDTYPIFALLFVAVAIGGPLLLLPVNLLWEWFGLETCQVTVEGIRIERRSLGLRLTRFVPAAQVTKLALNVEWPVRDEATDLFTPQVLRSSGPLEFMDGRRKVRFGKHLDDLDGQVVLSAILNRFPQYGAPSPENSEGRAEVVRRYVRSDEGDTLRLVFPSAFRPWRLLPAIWCVALAAVIFLFGGIASTLNESAWTVAWIFWAGGGAFALGGVALIIPMVFGTEILEVDGRALRLRGQVLGIGRTQEFAAEHIQAVRAVEMPNFGPRKSRVGFDYGARTYTVGGRIPNDLVPAAAVLIRERLARHV